MKKILIISIIFFLFIQSIHAQGYRKSNIGFAGVAPAFAGIEGGEALGVKADLGFRKKEIWNRRLDWTVSLTYGHYGYVIDNNADAFTMQAMGIKNDLTYSFIKNRSFEFFAGGGILFNYTTADIVIRPNFGPPSTEEVEKFNLAGGLLVGIRFKPRRQKIKYEVNFVNAILPNSNDFYELAFLQVRALWKM